MPGGTGTVKRPLYGARVLDKIDLFNILCVPGLSDAGAVGKLQALCFDRRAFYVVDPAESDTLEGLRQPTSRTAG